VVVVGLVEPLSDRELEVLRLLASGKPNQHIAEALVVALNSAKKHVGHILGELGAANRTRQSPATASLACCANSWLPTRYHSWGSLRTRWAGKSPANFHPAVPPWGDGGGDLRSYRGCISPL
jgi:DNA-binding CsgD family transcriptional regulator